MSPWAVQNPVNSYAYLTAKLQTFAPITVLAEETGRFVANIHAPSPFLTLVLAYATWTGCDFLIGPLSQANVFRLVHFPWHFRLQSYGVALGYCACYYLFSWTMTKGLFSWCGNNRVAPASSQ